MEVTDDTASSLSVDTAVDGSGKTGATAEKGAAGEASVFFTIPLTMTETPRPASTVSHENKDSMQTPTATNEGTRNSASSMTRNASTEETVPSELPSIHGPTEVVKHELPLADGMQQRQHSSSLTVTPTEHLALTEPNSVEVSASAGSICQGTVPTVSSYPSASKDSLDSVTTKEPPKKKKKNGRKKQHTLESEDHRGAVTAASPKSNRRGGRHKSTNKQTGALNVDEARCAANAQLAQVDETPAGNSEDAIALHQEYNVLLKGFNRRIPSAGKQALSGVVTHIPSSAARRKARSLRDDRRHKEHSPEAFLDWKARSLRDDSRYKEYSPEAILDRKTPDDAGNVETGPLQNRVHETPSQPGGSTLGDPQHPMPRSETGLSRTSDTEQSQASQVQVLEEKTAGSRGQKSASLLSSIDETAFSQTSSTSRTFDKDLDGRSNAPIMQPHSKTKLGDNLINNGVDPAKNPLSSNTRQPAASENVRRVLIPRSRYKARRVPIHTRENPPRDEFQGGQEKQSFRNLTDIPILAFNANKDEVELTIDVTAGKVLAEQEGDSRNVESSKGKLTPSQKNRLKVRRKKEQARATAASGPGVSMQSGLAQAQPNYSPQPHTSEEPSQLIAIPNTNTNVTMYQTPSSNSRQPISTIGQIQTLLRGMNSDYRKPSRSSAMGRSRGSRSARGRANASGDASNTGLNPMPSTPAFGHQIVERRQRGFQPQGIPGTVHHVTTGPSQSYPHQREQGKAAIEGSPVVVVSSPAVQIVTMNATTPEADPVHIEEALSASKNQPGVDVSTRPITSVHRANTSATLVASPPAVTSNWDTPSGSPEHLDWTKSISPNSFSFNDLPRWTLQPTFLSCERTNSVVPPQPALSKTLKDTGVPVPAKSVSAQAEVAEKPILKENEKPSIHPKKEESQNPPLSPGKYDGNGVFIPPHLRPPSPRKQLVDLPACVAAMTVLAEFEEEDAHLPPHLRRPARKIKPLKASPVSLVAAAMSQGALSGANGHLGNQEQHNLSTKTEPRRVGTPPNLMHGLEESTNTHMAVTAPRENPPVKSVLPAVLPAVPARALGGSKAFDNIRPSSKVWEQDSNAWGSGSIESNVAVNDGETRPKTKLQYEPQLHDWEGNWAPAPVEWDARPSFDNTDSRHMRAMEGWMDERADAALREPIQIDIRDPKFLDGGKPAGGLEKLDSPIEDEVSETLLPNDPFTHTRIHQTAEASALAYHKKAYKEKKLSKEDRKAYKVAAKLQNDSYVPPPNPHVPKANIYIRPAFASDMRQITQIYNHYVRNSVVASERDDLTEAQWQVRWRASTGENFAFLVAVLKSGNRGGRFRRDNAETIVGFAYAEDFSESGNMYRFTCELQFWVHHQHLRHGIGKTLIDRMLPALDNGYYCRQGTDFVAHNPIEYEGGGLRTIARILISIPHDATDAKEFTWQKKWLSQWDFEQVGNMPGIGRKFEKDIDVAQLMKITSVIVPRAS